MDETTDGYADSTPERQAELIRAAVALTQAGFAVVPIPRKGIEYTNAKGEKSLTTGKGPMMPGWQTERISISKLSRELSNPKYSGIGIISGTLSGDVICLDFDGLNWEYAYQAIIDALVILAKTLQAYTGSGRIHIYIRCPDMPKDFTRLVFRRDDAVIELRGNMMQAVAPPSIHPETGNPYEWVDEDAEIVELPFQTILDVLNAWAPVNAPESAAGAGMRIERGDARLPVTGRTRDFLANGAPGGEQRTRACGATRNLLSSGMPAEQVLEAIWEALQRCPQTGPDPWTRQDAEKLVTSIARSVEPPAPQYLLDPQPVILNVGNGRYAQQKPDWDGLLEPTATQTEPATGRGDKPSEISELTLATDWAKENIATWGFFEGEQWWQYGGGVWKHMGSEFVHASIQHFLILYKKNLDKRYCVTINPTKIRNVAFLAHSFMGPHAMNRFNANPLWIPLSNGVFDLGTESLLPHSPDNMLTNQLPFAYDPFQDCPTWKKLLNESLLTSEGETCEEWVGAVQEWFGYCLISDARAQVSMLWSGQGANGKGVVCRVLEKLVGKPQCTAVVIGQLDKEYNRASLFGKLVGFVNEPDPKEMAKNSEVFKAIVGGDMINARRPCENPFDFPAKLRLTITCNRLPRTNDHTMGYFRRLVMMEFRNNVPKADQDTGMDEKLEAELPGIFNWALVGLKRFQERRYRFAELPESQKLLEAYQLLEDSIARYFVEELTFDGASHTESKEIYRKYRFWCEETGVRHVETATKFGAELTKQGCKRSVDRLPSGPTRVWVGVRIEPNPVTASSPTGNNW